jgi:hypothetical protein
MRLANVLRAAVALGLAVSGVAISAQDEGGPGRVVRNPVNTDPRIKTTFVNLGEGTPGLLYEPVNPGPKAQIVVVAMHSAIDYLTHSSCTELSTRGYRVFCVNNSNSKSREFNEGDMDRVLLQMKAAVGFVRSYPGVRKIVLWGHSGGASVMTAYQDVAENGVKACQEEAKIYKCPNTLAGLPPADGVILGDPNWGIANDVLTGIDPAVTNDNGMKIDPALDMYNPANGFKPEGSSFSPEFIRKFTAAQAKRNNEVVDLALQRLAAIKAGQGMYIDNEPFIIAGAVFTGNKLYASDMSLLAYTQKPWPLVHRDGSITTGIVRSVRKPSTFATPSRTWRGALKTTVKGFLSTYAIRATPDFGYGETTAERGVIFRSTLGSNPGNAEGITVPFLTMGMTGSFEMGSAETIHGHVKGADKTLVYIEGATHNYNTCTKCEKTPGEYGDTTKTTYDYADKWLSQPGRFLDR